MRRCHDAYCVNFRVMIMAHVVTIWFVRNFYTQISREYIFWRHWLNHSCFRIVYEMQYCCVVQCSKQIKISFISGHCQHIKVIGTKILRSLFFETMYRFYRKQWMDIRMLEYFLSQFNCSCQENKNWIISHSFSYVYAFKLLMKMEYKLMSVMYLAFYDTAALVLLFRQVGHY